MSGVLIDARMSIRGLGIATYIDRLMTGFAELGGPTPSLWKGAGTWSRSGVASTLAHSGLFDISPRLDPRASRFDVVHYASNLGALQPGRNSVVTVHDLMYKRRGSRRHRVLGALLERSVARAGSVVTISDRTRTELLAAIPSLAGRVDVIPHGMRPASPHPPAPRRHLLAFGGAADPRKRTGLLIEAYRAYRTSTSDAFPLVVLARAGLLSSQRHDLASLGARIIETASAAEVDDLMAGAAALIYPTLEEGFGLPILEAAEAGTPVVMDAGASVATEVIGPHCFMADGESLTSWVDQIRQAAASAPMEHSLELPDWSAVAGAYQSLYDQAGAAR